MPDRTAMLLRTLGEVNLTSASGDVIPLRRKPMALLIYLARRAPRSASRAELATLLWGERSEDRARQSLRQAVLELKQSAGEAIDATTESVRVLEGTVRLDVAEFERLIREGRDDAAAESWLGEFVPESRDVASDAFERWVDGERVSLHRKLGGAMERLIAHAERRKDSAAALAWSERWGTALPLDERAHARLFELLRSQGRAREALDRHAEFVERVQSAMASDPSPEFMRLAKALTVASRREGDQDSHRPTAVRMPALVGFGHEIADFENVWTRVVAGQPALLLIDGGGGSGKTRICAELARVAASKHEDAFVLRTDARHSDSAPWSTAVRLFETLGDAPGLLGASAESLAEMSRLVPSIATSVRDLPVPTADVAALERALVQLLASVSEEGPVLVLLDDGQYADVMTRRLLAGAASRLVGRVAMVLVGDFGMRATESVLDILLSIPNSHRLHLPPLGIADVRQMISSMVSIDDDTLDNLSVRIHRDSGGVPHVVYELLATLVHEKRLLVLDHAGVWRAAPELSGEPLPISVSMRDWMAERLASLTADARAMLNAAAVLGPQANGALVETVAGLSPDGAASALRELLARRLAREDDDSGSIEVVPPALARVVYALLAPSERQALHARSTAELASIELTATSERSALTFHQSRSGPARVTPVAATPSVPSSSTALSSRRVALGIGALVLTVAVGSWALWAPRRTAPDAAADPRRVVIGAFQNRSGRTALDSVRDIAVDWIARGLDETGLVEVVGMGVGPDGTRSRTPIGTDQEVRRLAQSARAGTIVSGTIFQFGDTIELEAMITDARDGTLLHALPAVRASASDPLGGADRLRRQLVGTLVAMIDPRYDPGGATVRSPPSYEAYTAFMRGEEAAASGAPERAAQEYRQAAAADSTYSLPVLRLAYASYHMGRCDRVDSIGAALDRRRAQLSRFEGHYLSRVRAFCRADWVGANTAARLIADLAPRSQYAQFDAASSALSVNYPREALRRLRLMDPARGWIPPEGRYWITMALALHMAGDSVELRQLPARLRELQPEFYSIAAAMYAAGGVGRADLLARAASELLALAKHADAPRLLLLMPPLDELRAHGGAAAADSLSMQLAEQIGAGLRDGAAGDTARYAQAELIYRSGDWRAAHALAADILVRHRGNPLVLGLLGRSAARLGNVDEAQGVARQLALMHDPEVEGSALYLRAQLAALLGANGDAVQLLQKAATHGVPHNIDVSTIYLNHADIDLGAVLRDPTIVALLRPGG